MQFRVEKIGKFYAVLDENDVVYGRYDEKADAQASMTDWVAYFKEERKS